MALTVYTVRPPLGRELDVVDSYEGLFDSFDIAAEIWRLLGESERADKIEDIVAGAFSRKPAVLKSDAMASVLALLEPLEKAIVGPLTDADERLSPEKVAELRSRTQVFDLDEARGDDAQWAVSEAMFKILKLQHILRSAISEEMCLVFE